MKAEKEITLGQPFCENTVEYADTEPLVGVETSLDNLPTRQTGLLSYLPDNSLLCFLGLRLGKEVQLITRQKFGGPLIIKTNGRYIAVSRSLARQIKIRNKSHCQAVMDNNG